MEFTQEKKNQIEKEIVDISISALENNAINEDILGEVSIFVLSRIDKIASLDELKSFLKDLYSRWSVFEPLYREQIGEEREKRDEVVIEKAENLVKNGNIDEAIQIMKGAE